MAETKHYLEGYLPQVQDLARRLGVDTDYWDFAGNYHEVPQSTLVRVIDALGFTLQSSDDIERAHESLDREYWFSTLPKGLVVRQSQGANIPVHVPDGTSLEVWLETENGDTSPLEQLDIWVPARDFGPEGRRGEATFRLPEGTEWGYHTLHAKTVEGEFSQQVAVVPDRLPLGSLEHSRSWGVMTQLYSVTSRGSWGMGDFHDLGHIAEIFGRQGADFVLTNPLHAGEPNVPITPSPYLPVSRRFLSPLYIRPADIAEYRHLDSTSESLVKVAFAQASNELFPVDAVKHIDRDRSWKAKREALEVFFKVKRSPSREAEFRDFIAARGQDLQNFALWCALYDRFGQGPWEDDVADVSGPRVAALREKLAEQVEFYCWLQWIASTQLHAAQESAKNAGMTIGIMNDLAVGVHKYAADVWSTPDAYVRSMSVGAPPDMYNQLGQDWTQPPMNPRYMATHDWEPLRGIIHRALADCGALRIDHVMGLIRLWWIPRGADPNEGTYVRYNHEATVGIMLLEAARAHAVVVGEDLGTVEDWVRDYLKDRGILGTSVLWFERNGSDFKPPEQYREMCMAAVNTHDLPPTLGFLRAGHLEVQDRLGILPQPLEQAKDALYDDIAKLVEQLRNMGLLENDYPTESELILALHRFIGKTPAKLSVVSLVDAVGDLRMQNQPGTNNEYPNWRIPLSDSLGRSVKVEELEYYVGVGEICEAMRELVNPQCPEDDES